MKSLRIYILLISIFIGVLVFAQTKPTDTIKNENPKQLFIGIDLLNPVVSFFSDKKNFNGYISYKIKNRWVTFLGLGYEKNIYKKNDWDVEGKGIFGELGFNYILTNNYEKTGEGFYVGARLGFSPFKQNIKKYPIKGMNSNNQIQPIGNGSLSESNVSSGWLGLIAGAKVQLGNSPFYIDFMAEPKFILYSKKQDDIDNLVVPGYGKDKGNMNISLFWGISCKLF